MSIAVAPALSIRRFFGNLSVYSAARLFNRAVAFASVPIVAAYIGGVDAYGAKEYIEFLIVLAATVARGEILHGLVRFLSSANDSGEESIIFWTTSLFLLVSGVILTVPLLAFPAVVSNYLFDSPSYHDAIQCAGLIIFFNSFYRLGLSVLESRRSARTHALLSVSKAILEVTLKIIFLVPFGLGYLAIFLAVVIGDILFSFVTLICISRPRFAAPGFDCLKKLLVFSLPVLASNLCMFAVHQADRVFLVEMTDLVEVGLYGISWKFGTIVSAVVFAGFATAWFPSVFAINDRTERDLFASRTACLFMMVAGLLTLAAMMLAVLAVAVLPAEYQDALPLIRLVLAGHLFWFLYQIFSLPFFVHMRTGRVFLVSVLGLVVNLILNWFLVPQYGAVGAAVATLVTYLALAVSIDLFARSVEAIAFDRLRLYGLVVLVGGIYVIWSFGESSGLEWEALTASGLICCAAFTYLAALLVDVPVGSGLKWVRRKLTSGAEP